MSRLPAVLCLLSACATCEPLASAEVTGSPRKSVDVVARTVADFAAWTTVETCTRRIHVAPFSTKRDGRYNSANRGLVVHSDSADLPLATRHELCHAADLQNGLTDRNRADREAFAEVCALGRPLLGPVAALSCPTDEAPADRWTTVADRVYEPMPTIPLVEVGSWWPAGAPSDLTLAQCGASLDDLGVVLVADDGTEWEALLDPLTSAELRDSVYLTFEASTDGPHPEGWWTVRSAATDQGPVTLARVAPLDDSVDVFRLFHEVDGDWRVVDHCPDLEGSCFFEARGQAWVGAVHDGRFRWWTLAD